MIFLTLEDAIDSVRSQGFHVVDVGLLASAIERPQMSAFGEDAYKTIWTKAAAMLESLARNHALADGNKRTALRLTLLFLRANGYRLPTNPGLADFVVAVATGTHKIAAIAFWLETHCERVAPTVIHGVQFGEPK